MEDGSFCLDRFKKAKDYVYRLLKFRMRSEYEIIQRLKAKGFDENTINKTVSLFKDIGLIDDFKFCQLWIEERLKRPLGFYRILGELRQKGIDEKIIQKAIADKKDNYNEEENILKAISKKMKDKKSFLSLKDKRRLYNWLMIRGFDRDKVEDVIQKL